MPSLTFIARAIQLSPFLLRELAVSNSVRFMSRHCDSSVWNVHNHLQYLRL
jgi:hypothetical protein